jgi:hypothetical protein
MDTLGDLRTSLEEQVGVANAEDEDEPKDSTEEEGENNKTGSISFEISFSKRSDCGPSEIVENFLYLGACVF